MKIGSEGAVDGTTLSVFRFINPRSQTSDASSQRLSHPVLIHSLLKSFLSLPHLSYKYTGARPYLFLILSSSCLKLLSTPRTQPHGCAKVSCLSPSRWRRRLKRGRWHEARRPRRHRGDRSPHIQLRLVCILAFQLQSILSSVSLTRLGSFFPSAGPLS